MSQPMFSVTDTQRDRAIAHLQGLYAQGAIDEAELDRRLDLALAAANGAQLGSALQGLARIAPVALSRPRPGEPTPAENVGAGLVHLSGLFTWFVGPVIAKAVTTPGSRMWWEASRALSLQVALGALGLISILLSVLFGGGQVIAIAWVLWFAGTIYASLRAFNGQSSIGRLEPVLPLRPQAPRRLS